MKDLQIETKLFLGDNEEPLAGTLKTVFEYDDNTDNIFNHVYRDGDDTYMVSLVTRIKREKISTEKLDVNLGSKE